MSLSREIRIPVDSAVVTHGHTGQLPVGPTSIGGPIVIYVYGY
jgi:hypothetical protein